MQILRRLSQTLWPGATVPDESKGAPLTAYAAEISRTNPTCFLFLIDQSASMVQPFGGGPLAD